jgi:Tfp pilus assembly protein PilN
MRAVNLLPADLRGAAPKPARVRPAPAEGIGAYVVLGVLALCVAALAGYVLADNGVKQRQADLASAKQHTTVAQAKVAALTPYADFESLTNARVETVRGLAAARFDWQQALGDLSRAVPSDVKLASLNGDMGVPGAAGTGGDTLRGSIAAPAITLAGCASSQPGVARMMSRVKAVDGVTRVSLSKTTKSETSAGAASPCGEGSHPIFSLVVFFERAAAVDAFCQGAAKTAATVLTPNALNGGGASTPATPATSGASGSTVSPTSPTVQAGGTSPAPVTDGGTAPSSTPNPTGSTP